MNKFSLLLYSTICSFLTFYSLKADEIKIPQKQNTKLYLSIYNNNLGFVKDTRKVNLNIGNSTIAFEGVSEKIKAETAMLNGTGISVSEQNYDYAVLSPLSILENSIGQKVRIATTNPQTGEDILTPATIMAVNNGMPILKFNHGYETLTTGRIIYNHLPENLRTQPTLVINLNNKTAGEKELELAYLTQGLSWKANNIAEIISDDKLNLNGLVTLNNNSGTNYENAHIQLIAGDVNHEVIQPKIMRSMNMLAYNIITESSNTETQRENISDYHMYTLPTPTTIANKQVKQINLMNKEAVKFVKDYEFISPLSLSPYGNSGFFEEKNPQILFTIQNNKLAGLGEPIPAGIVRLYQNDNNGNLQFIGEDNINHIPTEGKIELKTGKAFDITINGKTTESLKLGDSVRQQSIEIKFNNSSNNEAQIKFIQDFRYEHNLIAENHTSKLENSNRRVWNITVSPHSEYKLTFSVRVSKQQ